MCNLIPFFLFFQMYLEVEGATQFYECCVALFRLAHVDVLLASSAVYIDYIRGFVKQICIYADGQAPMTLAISMACLSLVFPVLKPEF